MHGKEIFEVHIGKKKIRDVTGFFPIIVHVSIIVASVSVPVHPDKDFCSSIVLPYFPVFLHYRRILSTIRRPGDKMQ
jgi:hypothetical protein